MNPQVTGLYICSTILCTLERLVLLGLFLIILGGSLRRGHAEKRDAAATQGLNAEGIAVDGEDLTGAGHGIRKVEHEAGDGLELVRVRDGPAQVARVIDREATVN